MALGLLIALAVALDGGAAALATAPSPYWTPIAGSTFFSPTSVWNRALGAEEPVDPNSSSLVADLLGSVNAEQAGKYGPWIASNGFSTPIYTVPAEQPQVPVALENVNPYLQSAFASVPLPPEAHPASGSDEQLVVWQPATNTMWEFWKLHQTLTGWSAKWGGVINNMTNSPGIFMPSSYPGARTYWGATGSGLPLLGGLITIQDLEQGHIDHALSIAVPDPQYKTWSWPAVRTDGQRVVGIPEGTHFRLNPSIDLSQLKLPPVALMIARAAQQYGIIVRDFSPTVEFYAEEPGPTGGNPYPRLLGGQYPWQVLGKFPWSSLEVIHQQIDTTPPRTTITAQPAAASKEATPTFLFSSSKPGSVFECEVDAAPYPTHCDGGYFTPPTLADGWHQFRVKAIDPEGDVQPWATTYWWAVDTDAPVTTLISEPSTVTNQTWAQFTFLAKDTTASTFQCELDGSGWAPCSSGVSYSYLSQGSHLFQVQATDAAGNVAPTATSYSWTVDSTPPETSIVSGPPSVTSATGASFTLTSSKPGSSIRCSWDNGEWQTCVPALGCLPQAGGLTGCAATVEIGGLGDGSHSLRAQAIDSAGNVDPEEASYVWTVDTDAPVTTLSGGPPAVTASQSAQIAFSATDVTASTFECQIDTEPWFTCASPLSISALTDGVHVVQVRATDAAGNTELSPPSVSWTVDTQPPVTTVSSAPPSSTNQESAQFDFTASDTTPSTFECQLDGTGWAPCSSGVSYSLLVPGPHVWEVRATDAAGNVQATPFRYAWTVDTDIPTTTIESGPQKISRSPQASFTFAAADSTPSTFECRLDEQSWQACVSPLTLEGLSSMSHHLEVRATDAAGNLEQTPARYDWTVDTEPPVTSLSGQPPTVSRTNAASFSFSASKPGATFECRVDASAWTACSSPASFESLADGTHSFSVRATDEAGSVEESPLVYRWTVDTDAPVTTISTAPPSITNSTATSIAFSSQDTTESTYECRLDGATWASCASPATYPAVSEGIHTFEVRATDAAGNTETHPASISWLVELTPPETAITASPLQGISRIGSVAFGFTSSKPGSSFQCRLDGGSWSACTSPARYEGLSAGAHVFSVRATDPAGNVDPHPPSQAFTVSPPSAFAPTSYLNAPLDPAAPIAHESDEAVSELQREVNASIAAKTGPTIATTSGSATVYQATSATPTVKVTIDKPASVALQQALASVPIPPGARPSAGSGAQMIIWQPSSDSMWEFRGMSLPSSGWHAAWGGQVRPVSTSPGYFSPAGWGATGSAIPLYAGMLTVQELQAGTIEHALSLQLPAPRASQWSWPAQRTDGFVTGAASIPEGTRYRLDPGLNVASLNASPLVRMLALAAQRYGIVVRGWAPQVTFYAEDTTPTGTNPYTALFGPTPLWQQLAAFPWARLQALPAGP